MEQMPQTTTAAVEQQLHQQQTQQQDTNSSLSTATSTTTTEAAATAIATASTELELTLPQTYQLSSIEATIIDIPSNLPQTATTTAATTAPAVLATTTTTTATSVNISTSTFINTCSSASSSSYDTDSSVASSTCCTRHGEHIYMQRVLSNSSHSCSNGSGGGGGGGGGIASASSCNNNKHNAETLNDTTTVMFKADYRKSWPIFILLISTIEIIIFVYDLLTVQQALQQQQQTPLSAPDMTVPIPTDSVFIYRPDRRLQVWRFVSYMFLHANWFHLGFNVVVQLFYGIPLEVMHGSARVAVIYFAGVFAGSLGTSVVDSEVYLVGASGGVYALLAAHLANITLNYGQMKYAVAQLVSVVIFVSCDLGYALYTQYLTSHSSGIGSLVLPAISTVTSITPTSSDATASAGPPVSYIAHLTGALAGLTIGLLVLKNFEQRAYENVIWWMALGIYCAFTVFAIVFNLINTVTGQLMEEQGEVITQHLLHDLGVS